MSSRRISPSLDTEPAVNKGINKNYTVKQAVFNCTAVSF